MAKKATTWHHRQSRGLVNHQEIAVVMDHIPLIGDGFLLPWGAMPTEAFPTQQLRVS
tara:strand:- start:2804 stop:2974 length:171 start_codon:yes stop_codon:yes gene_type:complete